MSKIPETAHLWYTNKREVSKHLPVFYVLTILKSVNILEAQHYNHNANTRNSRPRLEPTQIISYHRLFPPPRVQVCPVIYTVVSRPALRLGAENCRLILGGVTNWLQWLGLSVCF